MSNLTMNAAGGRRAQLLAEAVVSAYIHELAPPRQRGRPPARVRRLPERADAPPVWARRLRDHGAPRVRARRPAQRPHPAMLQPAAGDGH